MKKILVLTLITCSVIQMNAMDFISYESDLEESFSTEYAGKPSYEERIKRSKQKKSSLAKQVKSLKNEIKKQKVTKPVRYGLPCP